MRSLMFVAVLVLVPAVLAQDSSDKDIRRARNPAERFDAGRKWAVVIGANEYLDPTLDDLKYCVADAHLLAETLAEKCGYDAKRILVITDDQANAHLRPLWLNLQNQIANWLKNAEAGDTVLVFFSGHGFLDAGGQGFLAPQNYRSEYPGLTALRTDNLRDMLNQCKADQKILILDCCHSGGEKDAEAQGFSSQELGLAFKKAAGLITLASCDQGEKSREWDAKSHGLFTWYLSEGLKGSADYDSDKIVDSSELYRYTFDNVSLTAQREWGASQSPKLLRGEDVDGLFALARVGRTPVLKPQPLETRRQVTAVLTVREGNKDGPAIEGAKLELLCRVAGETEATVLDAATSDNQGKARLTTWLSLAQQTEGEFTVLVTSGQRSKSWPLPEFPETLNWNVCVPSPAFQMPITNSLGMKLALIPAGEFLMGSSESLEAAQTEAYSFPDQQPQHRVKISTPFYLGVYEVTVGQFGQFISDTEYQTDAEKDGEGGWGWNESEGEFESRDPKYNWRSVGFKQHDNHPVVNLSWNDAVAFCEWLSRKEGYQYRLPTEAEWEYACRAGSTTRYFSGNDPESLAQVGNVADGTARDGYVFTSPVGSFRANAFGLFDMHGNVSEWCVDWYDREYYDNSPAVDPRGPSSADCRVVRGGSYREPPDHQGSAYRDDSMPASRSCYCGFRVCLVPADEAEALYMAASAALEWGHNDLALKHADAFLSKYSSHKLAAEALYIASSAALERGHNDLALKHADAFLSKYSDHKLVADVMHVKSKSHFRLNQLPEAEALYKRLWDEYPNHRDVDLWGGRRGSLLQLLGKHQEAIEVLQLLWRRYPQSVFVAEVEYMIGTSQMELKLYEAAAATFEALLERHPEYVNVFEAFYQRALALKLSGNELEAATAFQGFVARFPDHQRAPEAYFNMGECAYGAKEYDRADRAFQDFLVRSPEHERVPEAIFNIGECSYGKKEYDRAAVAYYKVLTSHGKKSELGEKATHKLAWSYYHQGSFDSAQETLSYQLNTYPQGVWAADAAFLEAECFFKLKKFGEALEAYGRVNKDVTDVDFQVLTLLHAGQAAGQLNQWEQSLEFLDECIEQFPESQYMSEVLYECGWAHQNLDNLEESLKLYRQVIATGAQLAAKAQFMIGEIQFGRKEYEEAIKSFFKVMYDGYDDPTWQADATFEAARCSELLKKYDQAVKLYQELIDKFPQSDKLPVAKGRIEELNPSR